MFHSARRGRGVNVHPKHADVFELGAQVVRAVHLHQALAERVQRGGSIRQRPERESYKTSRLQATATQKWRRIGVLPPVQLKKSYRLLYIA